MRKSTVNPILFWNRILHALNSSRQGMKDTVINALPSLVGVLTGFFSTVLIARGLGPTGMGHYALISSLLGVATNLSDLGIGQTTIRYASRAAVNGDTASQMAVLRWSLRLRLFLVFFITSLFFLLVPYIAKIWRSEGLTPYFRLGLLGGIFVALSSVPTIYFQSIKRFSTNATVSSVNKIISFTGIAVLSLFSLLSLLNLLIVNLIVSVIGAFVFLTLVPKAALFPQQPIHLLKNLTPYRFFASPVIPGHTNNELDSLSPIKFVKFHMLATIISMLTMQADTWLMGYFLDDKGLIGIYNGATRFILPMTIALSAFNTTLWPRAAGITERNRLTILLKKTLSMSVLLSILMAIYAFAAPLLAPLLFGSEFQDSRLLGQILCLRYVFAMLICPVTILGYSFGLVRVIWIVNLVQLFVLVIFNILFLPKIGPLASALALLLHEVLGSCAVGLIIFRQFHNLENQLKRASAAS